MTDFPGVDPDKFDEWKLSRRESVRGFLWGTLVAILVALFTLLMIGGAAGVVLPLLFWIVFILSYVKPRSDRARELARTMGITRVMIKRALHSATSAHG